ncbi:MAG: superoxide dismutase [Asticcacaulis sp.]
MTENITRRQTLAATLGIGATLTSAGYATAQTPKHNPSSGRALSTHPLAFDPKSVPGFSERIIRSHHENNYAGAVRRIGAIQAELSTLDPGTTPGFKLNGLKREELLAINSMILHEIYFASFGPDGVPPGGPLAAQLEADFGSHAAWRKEFVAMGKALGGGSGWVVLAWSPRLGRLVNQWAADHSMSVADGVGLIALDMYEHAYHLDFGANAGAYVDAFMNVLDWRNANTAFEAVL